MKDFEPLDSAVDVLDQYAEARDAPVPCPLLARQLAFARLLDRRQAEGVQPGQPLVAFVGDKQNAVKQAHAAAFEKLEVMHGAGRFVRAEDFAALPVDQDLILDGMAFLLAGIRFLLFF